MQTGWFELGVDRNVSPVIEAIPLSDLVEEGQRGTFFVVFVVKDVAGISWMQDTARKTGKERRFVL